jgi:hypothetical protein
VYSPYFRPVSLRRQSLFFQHYHFYLARRKWVVREKNAAKEREFFTHAVPASIVNRCEYLSGAKAEDTLCKEKKKGARPEASEPTPGVEQKFILRG